MIVENRPYTTQYGLVSYANPLQGTYSSFHFSTGNTLPLIALPHGMTHWSAQTGNPDNPWFFHPNDRVFSGIRATHQPSPWMGDYGCFVLMPQTGDCKPETWERSSAFPPELTEYVPHFFQTRLLRYPLWLQFAPTERCAVLRTETVHHDYRTVPRRLLLDLFPGDSDVTWDRAANRVTGYTRKNVGSVPENFAFYFVFAIDVSITNVSIHESTRDGHRIAIIELSTDTDTFLTRVGTSFISVEQAALNLEREIGDKEFGQVRADGETAWNDKLERVRLPKGDAHQTFYSCLYRALLFPRKFHEPDAGGNPHHYSPYTGRVEPGVLYTDTGFWDTARTVYPLLSLIYPDLLGEMIEGFLNAYRESGWLPEWCAPGHHSVMIGSFSQAVIADAIVKGIEGFDRELAFEAILKAATVPVADRAGYGREALAEYDALGYVPCDRINKATSRTLDYAYTDYCVAEAARALGKNDLYEQFKQQSERWRNVWDPQTQFFRGKQANGEWQTPFDEYEWGGAFVEGSAHQFRFSVPHDPQGLAECYGSADAMAQRIASMASGTTEYRVGSYRETIHEMTEMAVAQFGQYAQSNQPVHGALSMAAAVGHPDVTNRIVRRILANYYSPDILPGDEDNGEMASWYVLSALGVYPLASGSGQFVLNVPLFPEAVITLPNGSTLRIAVLSDAPHRDGTYRWKITWNGVPVTKPTIAWSALAVGGELVFDAPTETV